MNDIALFVRHRAKPGQRDEVRRIWEKYVKPRVEANPAHLAYYFCYDDNDPDVVSVFQLYRDGASLNAFMVGGWYPTYLEEIAEVVTAPPDILAATAVWTKTDS